MNIIFKPTFRSSDGEHELQRGLDYDLLLSSAAQVLLHRWLWLLQEVVPEHLGDSIEKYKNCYPECLLHLSSQREAVILCCVMGELLGCAGEGRVGYHAGGTLYAACDIRNVQTLFTCWVFCCISEQSQHYPSETLSAKFRILLELLLELLIREI